MNISIYIVSSCLLSFASFMDAAKQAFPTKVAGIIVEQVAQKSLEYNDHIVKLQAGLKPYQEKIEQLEQEYKKIDDGLKNAGAELTPEARRQRQARQAELATARQAQMELGREYALEERQKFEMQFLGKVKEAALKAGKQYGWDSVTELAVIVNEDCNLTEETAQELNNEYLAHKKKPAESKKSTQTISDEVKTAGKDQNQKTTKS